MKSLNKGRPVYKVVMASKYHLLWNKKWPIKEFELITLSEIN